MSQDYSENDLDKNLILIGKLSKLSGVNSKTLRYYDEIGLLSPSKVSEFTGYRYYDRKALQALNNIHALQEHDFTLAEIKKLTPEVITKKIDNLIDKYFAFQKDISFLNYLKLEVKMDKTLSDIEMEEKNFYWDNAEIYGQWNYLGEVDNYAKAINKIEIDYQGEHRKIFKQLFFQYDGSRLCYFTDTKYLYPYHTDKLNTEICGCEYNIIRNGMHLILCKQLPDYQTKFIIFTRVDARRYSRDELKELIEKKKLKSYQGTHSISEDKKQFLLGEWKYVDMVKECDLNKYPQKTVEVKNMDIKAPWEPHYSTLKFNDDLTVQTIEDGKFWFMGNRDNPTKKITPEESIYNYAENYIYNTMFKDDFIQPFETRLINGKKYLFLKTLSYIKNVDLDEEFWVYEQV